VLLFTAKHDTSPLALSLANHYRCARPACHLSVRGVGAILVMIVAPNLIFLLTLVAACSMHCMAPIRCRGLGDSIYKGSWCQRLWLR